MQPQGEKLSATQPEGDDDVYQIAMHYIVYYRFHDPLFLNFMDEDIQEPYETAREQLKIALPL